VGLQMIAAQGGIFGWVAPSSELLAALSDTALSGTALSDTALTPQEVPA
jgi:hypothetical protein